MAAGPRALGTRIILLLLSVLTLWSTFAAWRYAFSNDKAGRMVPYFKSEAANELLRRMDDYSVHAYPPLPPTPNVCPREPLSSAPRPPIFVDNATLSSSEPVNAAIVFLIEFLDRPLPQNHREMMRFNKALWLLWENFNKHYNYPILIFHEPAFAPQYRRRYRRMWPKQLNITFYEVEFAMPKSFPTTEPVDELGLHPTNRRAFPGYNHMIHFFFKDIFDHPAIRDLEYFWRLDHDSEIRSPVQLDLFKYMKNHGLRYGYRTITTDALHVTDGLLGFFDQYRRDPSHIAVNGNTCAAVSQRNCLKVPATKEERREYPPLMYYNNFEIVHVPTWRSTAMRQLAEAVDKTDMIYWDRWGDAPLR